MRTWDNPQYNSSCTAFGITAGIGEREGKLAGRGVMVKKRLIIINQVPARERHP